jgi:hypothetical protein
MATTRNSPISSPSCTRPNRAAGTVSRCNRFSWLIGFRLLGGLNLPTTSAHTGPAGPGSRRMRDASQLQEEPMLRPGPRQRGFVDRPQDARVPGNRRRAALVSGADRDQMRVGRMARCADRRPRPPGSVRGWEFGPSSPPGSTPGLPCSLTGPPCLWSSFEEGFAPPRNPNLLGSSSAGNWNPIFPTHSWTRCV